MGMKVLVMGLLLFIGFKKKRRDKMREQFSDILRQRLNDKQFVEFVMNWFDPDMLCDMIEDSFDNSEEEQQEEYLELIKTYLTK